MKDNTISKIFFLIMIIIICYNYSVISQTYYYSIDGFGRLTLLQNARFVLHFNECTTDSGEYRISNDTLYLTTYNKKYKIEIINKNDEYIQKNIQNEIGYMNKCYNDYIVIYDECSNIIYRDSIKVYEQNNNEDLVIISPDIFNKDGEYLIQIGIFCPKYWIKVCINKQTPAILKIHLFYMFGHFNLDRYKYLIHKNYLFPISKHSMETFYHINRTFMPVMKKGKKNKKYELYKCALGPIY